MLKHKAWTFAYGNSDQPPSGGCVLKHLRKESSWQNLKSAAFGRLCVETGSLYLDNGAKGFSRLRAAVC